MGIFSKITKSVGKILSDPIGSILGNPGSKSGYGTNDLIGGALNDVTGTSDSARQQYKYNKQLQDDAQNFNAQQAQIERQWQEQMSNTARQRAVSDLQSAGLNPVLAAGTEASSGAGAAATSPGASTGAGQAAANPISMIQALVSTINSAKKANAEINKIDKEITKIEAETTNINQNTKNGGTGGTSFTRTVNWGADKVKKVMNKVNKTEEKWQEKGKNLSWQDFKSKLKHR